MGLPILQMFYGDIQKITLAQFFLETRCIVDNSMTIWNDDTVTLSNDRKWTNR